MVQVCQHTLFVNAALELEPNVKHTMNFELRQQTMEPQTLPGRRKRSPSAPLRLLPWSFKGQHAQSQRHLAGLRSITSTGQLSTDKEANVRDRRHGRGRTCVFPEFMSRMYLASGDNLLDNTGPNNTVCSSSHVPGYTGQECTGER